MRLTDEQKQRMRERQDPDIQLLMDEIVALELEKIELRELAGQDSDGSWPAVQLVWFPASQD